MVEPDAYPSVDPVRGDHVVRALPRVLVENPGLLAIAYLVLSLGVFLLLEQLFPGAIDPQSFSNNVDPRSLRLSTDTQNLINFGLVIPCAVFLVISFYRNVRDGLAQIIRDNVVRFKDRETAVAFLETADHSINAAWIAWAAWIAALVCNGLLLLTNDQNWNGDFGRPQAWWFRLLAIINFFVLYSVLLKSIAVVRTIRRLFDHDVDLQPLHPDGCGGLRSLGQISMSLNYFLCLIAVYLAILAFVGPGDLVPFEETGTTAVVFLPFAAAYAVLSGYLFFAPLARAHDIMSRRKQSLLQLLNEEFQRTYESVFGASRDEVIDLEEAQKVESLDHLHRVASRMPVWPVDTRLFIQFGSAIILPVLIVLIEFLINQVF